MDTSNTTAKEIEEIKAVGAGWSKAIADNDAERIGNFMADDWVIVSERGISEKERFLSFVRSGALTHSMFEMVGEPLVKFYGDTAVFTTRVVNTAHFGGQQFDADEWTSDVFVRVDGKWLCVLSHISSVDKNFDGGTEDVK